MENAIACNTSITCKPEVLEGYWLKTVLEFGNNSLAKLMGIHPTALSRDKARIAKLASQMVHQLGLPKGSVAVEGCEQNIVITGEEAKKLLSILEHIRA
ncbi:hypothetical protein [Yersinia rochesterensis]|uniref:hypothetical protein n=1 Tax=Yersinia rochesterensis TaxID=1604335 RepID=UPI0011A91705|nr:hypothetical protein [Yersinia rochesterensis]